MIKYTEKSFEILRVIYFSFEKWHGPRKSKKIRWQEIGNNSQWKSD